MTLLLPEHLYKFISSTYVGEFRNRGNLLFRNLTSFKQMEDQARGDVREGCHVDSPDNDVTVTNRTTGTTVVGRFSVRTSINTDKIYVLCLTSKFKHRFFADFGCDRCVEIYDPSEFIKRCRRALPKVLYVDKTGLIFQMSNIIFLMPISH